jgi:EAL domain-containing protein (putative c-di-GMP-specific phosphodiesterase class I)
MKQSGAPKPSVAASFEDLAAAIAKNELVVHYQPIMNLVDETLVGFEAIARWPHERLGLLDAGTFVPLAGSAGLIRALDSRVLARACDQLADWQRDVLIGPGFHVSVNISGAELDGDGYVERVGGALAFAGASAKGLVLEVTETSAIESFDAARRTFDGLHALGVELALDDFGREHTTFSRLHSLPFDIVKLDRDFVLESNTKIGKSFIRALVQLGGHLGTRLIAKGIETSKQAATLRGLGCEDGQGYLWAPGLPADEAEKLLSCPLPDEIAGAGRSRS